MDKKELNLLTPDALLSKLNTSESGLASKEAQFRLKKFGYNELKKSKSSALRILFKQFTSSLIYLLIIAAAISLILRDFSDAGVITAILLINALLGFFQEYRSEKAIEKLEKLINREARVRRDGKDIFLSEKELVPGDIATINEGDIVPADIFLLSVDSLEINESLLSGETNPIKKFIQGGSVKDPNISLAFAGSVVEEGQGIGVVYATGYNTQLGKIASLSQQTRKVTQYEKSLTQFSNYLMRITLLTLGIIFIAKLFITHDITHIAPLLLFIIALAITVIPEALPVIATVTLANGAMQLAKRNVVVKRLSALEDLGNITLLCTDKTGTLTENIMTVKSIVAKDLLLFQKLAIATLQIREGKRKRTVDSYSEAFSAYVKEEIKSQAKEYKQIEDLGFDPNSRRRRVILQNLTNSKYFLVDIGSTETLLSISKSENKEQIHKEIQEDGKQGIRNIAFAYKEIPFQSNFNVVDNERGLTFIGYARLLDPLKPTSKKTIALAQKLGVGIKVLTGDSKEVAEFVGDEIGLLQPGHKVYTGEELDKMSQHEFENVINTNPIFAKVTPEQKYKIIKVLKEKNVVAYQGDGINDAPSLKLADVGIAVNTAADVAKDSAEILLLRKDLEVIINGIKYGRTIFVNINKYIKYTMVGNFGNFFALAGLYLMSQDLPLLPIQLLLTSLITDLPHIFIYSDNVNSALVKKPQSFNIHNLMFISLILGTLTTVFEFIFFATLKLDSTLFTQTSLFLFLTFIQLIVIFSIRNTGYFWEGKHPSFMLTSATVAVCIVSVILTLISPLNTLFSFAGLSIQELSIITLITVFYFIVLDVVKVWYYKMQEKLPVHTQYA